MKLIFSKPEDGEPNVKLAKSTVEEEFSYIELIKGLLEGDNLDLSFTDDISEEEQKKLKGMVERINTTVKERLEMD